MPIYEYACKSCGHRLEVLQKINDAPLTDCPACGAPALGKLVSAAGFVLKGGGWYVTDFKEKGNKNKKEQSGDGAGKQDGKTQDGKTQDSKTQDSKTQDSKKDDGGSTPPPAARSAGAGTD